MFTHLAKLAFITAVAVGALAAPAAAVTAAEPDGGRHANVGALLVRFSDAGLTQLCSGSLIAGEEFLTAGHCTEFLQANVDPADAVITFEEDLNVDPATGTADPATSTPVAGWTTMPGFRSGVAKSINDVGVVHLAATVPGTAPVQLPRAGLLDSARAAGGLAGHEFTNVGYGVNDLDRSVSSPNVAISWAGRRMASTTRFKSLTPDFLEQHGGNCFGDSGGPHFWSATGPLSNLTVAVTSATDPTCGSLASNQRLDTPEPVAFLARFTP